jgi:hypothetical protein
MRAFEFLQESQGGIFRRAQEVGQGTEVRFKNAQSNHEIALVSAQMVPPTEQYQTEEELDQGLQAYLKPILGPNFMELSQFTGEPSKARAALVSIWKDISDADSENPNEKPVLRAFIKLVNKVGSGAAPVLQTNADFKKDFGYGAGGKTAQRQTLQLKPKYVLETNAWLTVQGVVQSVTNTVSNRSDLDPVLKNGLIQLVKEVAQGKSQPVPGMAEYETSLEVDYGEIPAPIALLTGKFVSGDYQKAEQGLLKPMGLSWGQLKKILYPDAGDEKLYDSYIQIDSKNKLRISSKDKKGGAAASVTGLVDEMNNTPEKYQDITDDKRFQPLIQMLKTIANPPNMYWNRDNKGINGPLILGVDTFKFIDANDAKNITSLMNDPKSNRLHPDDAFKKGIISDNLHNLIPVKGAKYNDPAYNLGYHLLACVAKNIANIVNKDPNTDALFRTILERSNMIQVKTTVKSSGDAASFTDFKVIYPPIFEGRFLMIADNNYMATRKPIAPLSFAIK